MLAETLKQLFLVIVLYGHTSASGDPENVLYAQVRCEFDEEMVMCNDLYNKVITSMDEQGYEEGPDYWIYFGELEVGAFAYKYMRQDGVIQFKVL